VVRALRDTKKGILNKGSPQSKSKSSNETNFVPIDDAAETKPTKPHPQFTTPNMSDTHQTPSAAASSAAGIHPDHGKMRSSYYNMPSEFSDLFSDDQQSLVAAALPLTISNADTCGTTSSSSALFGAAAAPNQHTCHTKLHPIQAKPHQPTDLQVDQAIHAQTLEPSCPPPVHRNDNWSKKPSTDDDYIGHIGRDYSFDDYEQINCGNRQEEEAANRTGGDADQFLQVINDALGPLPCDISSDDSWTVL